MGLIFFLIIVWLKIYLYFSGEKAVLEGGFFYGFFFVVIFIRVFFMVGRIDWLFDIELEGSISVVLNYK